eukprot:1678166-Rhodomonas_salina.1
MGRLRGPCESLVAESEKDGRALREAKREVLRLRREREALEGEMMTLEAEYEAEQKLSALLQTKVESLHAMVTHHQSLHARSSDEVYKL